MFVIPQGPGTVGEIIDCLLLVWTAPRPDEWRQQIVYLPFR
jgi:hypothetical protein